MDTRSSRGEQRVVLAIDQGTTNTKALLVTSDGAVVSSASRAVSVAFPRPGWVEQDAREIWSATAEAARAVLADRDGTAVVGLALSTQRESAIVWSASSGEPLGPVLGWQDARTAGQCEVWAEEFGELVSRRTGLGLDPMYSAPKLRWLIDAARAEGADLHDIRVGTVDSWLLQKLTGRHSTEAGNASRTLLLDLRTRDWDDELVALFGIPRSALPAVLASDADFGHTLGGDGIPAGLPVLAVMADSHAALFAQGCTRAGQAKATYGTGTSVMTPYGGRPESAPTGLTTTLAWLTREGPTYALEGNILATGAALEAMARMLGLDGGGAELSVLAGQAEDSGGVCYVPAFTGLGAPYWDRGAQGALTGLSSATTRAQLARAALEGVAHQVADVVSVMEHGTGTTLSVLCADGGATTSDLLMQIQADVVARPVRVTTVAEASALGAALLAWSRLASTPVKPDVPSGRTFVPSADERTRAAARDRWAAAIARSRGVDAHQQKNLNSQMEEIKQ